MAVVADFTSDVMLGIKPLTVTFTDTSTGSPTHWLWDFGDGSYSNEQNPVHIYEVDGSYDVTLKAYISTGSTDVSPSRSNSLVKVTSNQGSEAAAWSEFQGLSFTSGELFISGGTGVYELTRGALGYQYAANKLDFDFDLSAYGSSQFAELLITFGQNPPQFNEPGLGIKMSTGNGKLIADKGTTKILKDVTANLGGSVPTFTLEDLGNYPRITTIPAINNTTGYAIKNGLPWFVRVHTATEMDTKIKNNYIHIGPPVADFSANIQSGANRLLVSFTNLTLGGTTYSWKKRKAGTSDPFVEFSTAENPSHLFDKENP